MNYPIVVDLAKQRGREGWGKVPKSGSCGLEQATVGNTLAFLAEKLGVGFVFRVGGTGMRW